MNSFLLFVLLSSIAVVVHSKGQARAAGYPSTIREYSVPVKEEYMAIINIKDSEEKLKKMREWGVKNGKEAEVIAEEFIKKMERNKNSKTKEEKKKEEPKKETKKETKNDPKKDSKKA